MQKKERGIPESLKHFDQLPDSAHVKTPTVQGLTGWSSTTVWRRVQDGTLKVVKLGPRNVGFRVGDVRAMLASMRQTVA